VNLGGSPTGDDIDKLIKLIKRKWSDGVQENKYSSNSHNVILYLSVQDSYRLYSLSGVLDTR